MKHTPAPWQVNFASSYSNGVQIDREIYVFAPITKDDVAICADICDPSGETDGMANAHLIAAAPELLTELENCVFILNCDLSVSPNNTILQSQISKAKAAIAKAKGEV